MNKITICGRLISDPICGISKNNIPFAKIMLVSTRNGNGQEKDYFKCIAYYDMANKINRYCKKASYIIVIGSVIVVKKNFYSQKENCKPSDRSIWIKVDNVELVSGTNKKRKQEIMKEGEGEEIFNELDFKDVNPSELPF